MKAREGEGSKQATHLSRKEFLAVAMGSVVAIAAPRATAEPRPRAISRTLIRSAELLTMDRGYSGPGIADVLIEGERIAAIEPNLGTSDAEIVDGTGMILMPGMVDGHRHLHHDLYKRVYALTNQAWDAHTKRAQADTPEALWQGEYLGGMLAIDSGVTSVLDFSHHIRSFDHAEAAALGVLASGVAGIFAPQLIPAVHYGPGDTIEVNEAWRQVFGPPDPERVGDLQRVRDRHFPGSSGLMKFGVGLTAPEFGPRTVEQAHLDFELAQRLEPAIMTQHVLGAHGDWRMGLPRSYRVIADFFGAGLLGPKYHVAHGNGLTDDELKMLADSGASLAATPYGEMFYGSPSAHGRAEKLGVRVGIGADDVSRDRSNDYFEILRAARLGLSRTDDAGAARAKGPTAFLELATIKGAEAIGQGDIIGSITPGKRADLVLLNARRDFFALDQDTASKVFIYANVGDIDSVWIAGRPRKRDGKLIGFDWAREAAEADRLARKVIAAADRITLSGKLTKAPFPSRDD